jgi:hypothetical protein
MSLGVRVFGLGADTGRLGDGLMSRRLTTILKVFLTQLHGLPYFAAGSPALRVLFYTRSARGLSTQL